VGAFSAKCGMGVVYKSGQRPRQVIGE